MAIAKKVITSSDDFKKLIDIDIPALGEDINQLDVTLESNVKVTDPITINSHTIINIAGSSAVTIEGTFSDCSANSITFTNIEFKSKNDIFSFSKCDLNMEFRQCVFGTEKNVFSFTSGSSEYSPLRTTSKIPNFFTFNQCICEDAISFISSEIMHERSNSFSFTDCAITTKSDVISLKDTNNIMVSFSRSYVKSTAGEIINASDNVDECGFVFGMGCTLTTSDNLHSVYICGGRTQGIGNSIRYDEGCIFNGDTIQAARAILRTNTLNINTANGVLFINPGPDNTKLFEHVITTKNITSSNEFKEALTAIQLLNPIATSINITLRFPTEIEISSFDASRIVCIMDGEDVTITDGGMTTITRSHIVMKNNFKFVSPSKFIINDDAKISYMGGSFSLDGTTITGPITNYKSQQHVLEIGTQGSSGVTDGLNNSVIQEFINKFGDRICNIEFDNTVQVLIGYESSLVRSTKDILLTSVNGIDMIGFRQISPDPKQARRGVTFVGWHPTTCIQRIDIIDADFENERIDPKILQ